MFSRLLDSRHHAPADFTIRSNAYKWKVHKDVLVEKSDHFAEICYDPQYDCGISGARVVIKGVKAWSTARFVQYIYFDDYEYHFGNTWSASQQKLDLETKSSGSNLSPAPLRLSLRQLVPLGAPAEEERIEALIDIDLAKIANGCKFEDLMDLTQANMILLLEDTVRTRHARECVTEPYPEVHQVLKDYLMRTAI